MNKVELILVKRYAQSFINVFGVQREWLPLLEKAAHAMHVNTSIVVILSLGRISLGKRKEMLSSLFILPLCIKACESLLELLLQRKRGTLFGCILQRIVADYYEHLGITVFDITTSHSLSPDQQISMQNFLYKKWGGIPLCVYTVDTSLIAGLRIKTTITFWEYSIRKQLRMLHYTVAR